MLSIMGWIGLNKCVVSTHYDNIMNLIRRIKMFEIIPQTSIGTALLLILVALVFGTLFGYALGAVKKIVTQYKYIAY